MNSSPTGTFTVWKNNLEIKEQQHHPLVVNAYMRLATRSFAALKSWSNPGCWNCSWLDEDHNLNNHHRASPKLQIFKTTI